MSTQSGYDVIYSVEGLSIERHHCREFGCHGTDPSHGFTFDEAKAEIISTLKAQITYWENLTEEQHGH